MLFVLPSFVFLIYIILVNVTLKHPNRILISGRDPSLVEGNLSTFLRARKFTFPFPYCPLSSPQLPALGAGRRGNDPFSSEQQLGARRRALWSEEQLFFVVPGSITVRNENEVVGKHHGPLLVPHKNHNSFFAYSAYTTHVSKKTITARRQSTGCLCDRLELAVNRFQQAGAGVDQIIRRNL